MHWLPKAAGAASSIASGKQNVRAASRSVGVFATRRAWPLMRGLASLLGDSLVMLATLLGYAVIMVVSAGVYSVRVAWADRFVVVTPLLRGWQHRSYVGAPLRFTHREVGGAAAYVSQYRSTLTRSVAVTSLAVLLGWIVAHAG
jgi:hypothetical protein